NHMEQAQADLAAIEALEKQYSQALLNAKGPISPEQQQQLDAMKADIDSRINAATAAAGLQAQTSQQRAYGMSFVETGLFTVVYTGSAFLGPLGLITGGVTKAFLQDLPNGKIRNNGDASRRSGTSRSPRASAWARWPSTGSPAPPSGSTSPPAAPTASSRPSPTSSGTTSRASTGSRQPSQEQRTREGPCSGTSWASLRADSRTPAPPRASSSRRPSPPAPARPWTRRRSTRRP